MSAARAAFPARKFPAARLPARGASRVPPRDSHVATRRSARSTPGWSCRRASSRVRRCCNGGRTPPPNAPRERRWTARRASTGHFRCALRGTSSHPHGRRRSIGGKSGARRCRPLRLCRRDRSQPRRRGALFRGQSRAKRNRRTCWDDYRRRQLATDYWLPATDDWSSDSQLLYFFVVVLAVEDVPFLGAFEDGAALAFDLLPGGSVEPGFLGHQQFQHAARFQADTIAVLEEVHVVQFGEGVGHSVRQLVDLFAAEPHSTALYFRTSSFLIFLNISW